MDAGQKLICKALVSLETYLSVLNFQKKRQTCFPVSGDHIQLLHDGNCHWLLSFSSSGRVQVYDSLRTNLTSVFKECLKSLYQPLLTNGKLEVTFLPVEKQTNGFNCGLFALVYASILFDGKYIHAYIHTIPYHTIPYHTIPYIHTIPYHTIPYHTYIHAYIYVHTYL